MIKYILLSLYFASVYSQTICDCKCPYTTSSSPTITSTTTTSVVVSTTPDYWKPVGELSWWIQYTGTINYTKDVDVYNIDLESTSANDIKKLHDRGIKVVCYLSCGSFENFRDDVDDFLPSDYGKILDGWPDERWLDTRSENVRKIMKKRILNAKKKNCDAIDPDNMDGFDNDTGFPLTFNTQLDYNKFISEYAHSIGLSVGLKNDLTQVKELINFFDFAVNEQCNEYSECNLLKPFVAQKKPVFHIEYKRNCKNITGFSSIIKKLSLNAYQINCI